MSTVLKTFLDGQVTGEFFDFRNYDRDFRADNLQKQIRQELGRPDDLLIESYAEFVVYTENFVFNWAEGAPDHFRAMETWWEMVEQGQPARDCYLYYTEYVSNPVTSGIVFALRDAHTIFRPVAARPDSELTPEELADPNSPSVAAPNGIGGGAG